MFERKVTKIAKDKQGDIIALCNPFEYWSPRLKKDVIKDIESNLYYYYVEIEGLGFVGIEVTKENNQKYLIACRKKTDKNKLITLPECKI